MKAKEVLKILRATRPTLCKNVKTGVIEVTKIPTEIYSYDEESLEEDIQSFSSTKYSKSYAEFHSFA